MPVVTVSPALAPNVKNIGPLLNPASFQKADGGRGRGRGHTAPYNSPGPVFSRLVVMLSGPGLEDVPRGREQL